MPTSSNSDEDYSTVQRLEQLTAELTAAQEDAHRLVRAISHQLTTPLTSTRWLMESLTARHSGALDDDAGKLVAQAIRNLDEMAGLIDGLVAHARLGGNSLSGGRLTSAKRALEQAMANLREERAAAQAELTIDDLPELPLESDALVCLLQNLISNALKFRRRDQPARIRVSAERETARWIVSVRDEGIGVSAANARRIFEPLQRLNSSIPGRGIGLATCRKIVERAGGTIWVDSKPGEGAIFRFSLPASVAENSDLGRTR